MRDDVCVEKETVVANDRLSAMKWRHMILAIRFQMASQGFKKRETDPDAIFISAAAHAVTNSSAFLCLQQRM